MITEKSTHIVLNNNKVIISSDLKIIFNFLIEIEKEINSLLQFEKQLEIIKKSYEETLGLTAYLAKKIEENNININYTLSENPDKIVEKFNFHHPMRAQFIILFANLETIFCLYVAYIEETLNDNDIRKKTMSPEFTRNFLDSFILTEENEYYKKNKLKFSRISAKQIRDFRNSLTHFFSVKGGICIKQNNTDSKAEKLENIFQSKGINNIIFISINDLSKLISGASKKIIKYWSDEYLNNPIEFKRKIFFVKSVVENNGTVIIKEKDLKI